jgi:hypothetical protein
MRAPGIMRAGMVSAIGVMIVLVMVTVVPVLLVMIACIAGRGLMRVMAPRRGVCACGNRLEQPELRRRDSRAQHALGADRSVIDRQTAQRRPQCIERQAEVEQRTEDHVP